MFHIMFSSESLQICCIDLLYHTYQYVGDYKFICLTIFWILGYFL